LLPVNYPSASIGMQKGSCWCRIRPLVVDLVTMC